MHSSILPSLAFLLLTTPFSSTSPIITKRSDPTPPTLSNLPAVALQAGGSIPNTTLPATISDTAVTAFQIVNFLENLESAFFLAALNNLTSGSSSFTTSTSPNPPNITFTTDVVRAIHAQELIHVATAEAILTHYNKSTFSPCQYTFPVTTIDDFITLADVITNVGLGGVIDVASSLALTDPALVPGPASILAIETRHDAFFRQNLAQGQLIPNPAPFDTRISAAFALNLGAPFIVPGSCASTPAFTAIPAMSPASVAEVSGSEGAIKFKAQLEGEEGKKYFVGWVNQANDVQYTDASVSKAGEVKSTIPSGMGGIAFAALTCQDQAKDVATLTGVTVAGPAPVRIS